MKIGLTAQVGEKDVASFNMAEFELPISALEVCFKNHVTPIILPETTSDVMIENLLNTVDGVIITGGSDVGTSLYGEKPLQYNQISCMPSYSPLRDRFEIKLIEAAVRLNKPVFGICRGIQIINVAFGGSLYQDLGLQYENGHDSIHHFQEGKSETPTHSVSANPNSMLYKAMGAETMVNSYHHQGIKTVGKGLNVVARASDGLIEGVESGNGLIQGVQWHPEQLWARYPKQEKIFRAFFERCERASEVNKNSIQMASD